jgi:hypothetical protein
MERFFSDLNTVQRFRSGPLSVYVQKLADELADSGFRRATIRTQLRVADHFGRWLHRRKDIQAASLVDIDAYMRQQGSVKLGDRKALDRLLTILEEEGVSRTVNVTNNPRDEFLQRFVDFLDRERGLCVGSIALRRRIANQFADYCFGVGAMDWPKIRAGARRTRRRSTRSSRWRRSAWRRRTRKRSAAWWARWPAGCGSLHWSRCHSCSATQSRQRQGQ